MSESPRSLSGLTTADPDGTQLHLSPRELDEPARSTETTLPSIPGYELFGVLGRGGMGVVYKARQIGLNRLVALKMIRGGDHADAAEVARFRGEAEAVARLQHPNIVQVYEVGEHTGQPFFSLEFVEGGSLAQKLHGDPIPAADAAKIIHTLATAVHAAHRAGVVHRDLKPANVLVTEQGEPKIADFGLAKRIDIDSSQTVTGAILGTPSYMAPEQAEGRTHDVGPATDIYALGAILHELLTGRPPFRGTTRLETLDQVRQREPLAPRLLVPATPHDLDTICLKCLQKDPARRYRTAEELADDLRRYQNGEPIHARPIGRLEVVGRWCRRNPVVAGLLLAVALSLIAGTATASWFAVQMYRKADEATRHADAAAREERNTRRFFYAAQMSVILDAWDRGDVVAVQDLLETLTPREGQEDLRGFEWHYLWKLVHGYRHSVGGSEQPCRSVAFLDDLTFVAAGKGHVTVWSAIDGKRKHVLADDAALSYSVQSAPGGKVVVLGWGDGKLFLGRVQDGKLHRLFEKDGEPPVVRYVWGVSPQLDALAVVPVDEKRTGGELELRELPSGRVRFTSSKAMYSHLTFSPDGDTLAAGMAQPLVPNPIRLLNAQTGEEKALLRGALDRIEGLTYTPNGATVAGVARDSRLRLWDVASSQESATLVLNGPPRSTVYSRNGRLLAVGPGNGAGPVELWDPDAKARIGLLWGHTADVVAMDFSPDGKWLITAGDDDTAKVWDATNLGRLGKKVLLPGPGPRVRAIAYAPDGKTLATAGDDHTVRLWDVEKRNQQQVLRGHLAPVRTLVYSNDGQTLYSGGEDGTIRRWEVATGREMATWRDLASVTALAAVPGGRSLLVATAGSGVQLRDAATGSPTRLTESDPYCLSAACSLDGRFFAAGGHDGNVHIWDAKTLRLLHRRRGHNGPVRGMTFTPDSRRLFSGGDDRRTRRWDPVSGRPDGPESAQENAVQGLAISPDGGLMAVCGGLWTSSLALWTLPQNRVPAFWFAHRPDETEICCVAFSPDGKWMACGTDAGWVRFVKTTPQVPPNFLSGHAQRVTATACSPDGGLLAEALPNFTVRIRDTATQRVKTVLQGHMGPIAALAISADGGTAVSGGQDRTVRVWNLATGEQRFVFSVPQHVVRSVAVSPDAGLIAAGDGDTDRQGKIWLWDTTTGRSAGVLEPEGWTVWTLAFSPDGQTLASGTGAHWNNLHGKVTLWDVAARKARAVLGRPPTEYAAVRHHPHGHAESIRAVVFSPDGRLLATGGGSDGTVRLWNVADGEQVVMFKGHTGGVKSLVFAEQGRSLISAGWEGTLRFWDIARLEPRGVLGLAQSDAGRRRDRPHTLAATADGAALIVGHPDGSVELLRAAGADEVAAYDIAVREQQGTRTAGVDHILSRVRLRVAAVREASGDAEGARATLEEVRQQLSELASGAASGREAIQQMVEELRGDEATVWQRLRAEGHDARALADRANALWRQGLLDDSATAAEDAMRRYPGYAVPRCLLGFVLDRKNRPIDAQSAHREAIRIFPPYPSPHLELGVLLLRQGLSDEAEWEYREAIRHQPNYPLAWNNLGRLLRSRNRYDEAVAAHAEAIRLESTYADAHYHLGVTLALKDQPAEAVAAFREVLRLEPTLADAHADLLWCLDVLDRHDEAIAAGREATRLVPDNWRIRVNLARNLVHADRISEAVDELRQAVRLRPDHAATHHHLAYHLWQLGRYPEAEKAAVESIRLKPDDPVAHNVLGLALLGRHLSEQAESSFREALRLEPDEAIYHRNLGLALYQRQRFYEAMAEQMEAIRLKADYAEAHHELGRTLLAHHQPVEAIAAFREAIGLQKNATAGSSVMLWSELATGQYQTGDGKAARETIERFIQQNDNGLGRSLLTLAKAVKDNGDDEYARQLIERGLTWAATHAPTDETLRMELKAIAETLKVGSP